MAEPIPTRPQRSYNDDYLRLADPPQCESQRPDATGGEAAKQASRPRGAVDQVQAPKTRRTALHAAAHGATRAGTSALKPIAQLSQHERAWAAKLATAGRGDTGGWTPNAPLERLFYKAYDGVHSNFAEVLGQLSPQGTKTLFGDALVRDRLAQGCVHAFIDRMRTGIAEEFTRVETRLGTLLAQPEQRAALWRKAGTAGAREKLLASLGVAPGQAKALARSSALPDAQLVDALQATKKEVGRAKEGIDYRLRLGKLAPSDVLALRSVFGGQAKRAIASLGFRPGSFAAKALAGYEAAGKRDQKLFTFYKVSFGVLAGVMGGGLVAATSVLGAAVVGAGAAGVMGAPDLVAQHGKRDLAQLAEALKIADKGSHEQAKRAFAKALKGYLLGVAGGALGGAAGAKLHHLLEHSGTLLKLGHRFTAVLEGLGVSAHVADGLVHDVLASAAQVGLEAALEYAAHQAAHALAHAGKHGSPAAH